MNTLVSLLLASNILVITTDDLSLSTLEAQVSGGWAPNISLLQAQGMTFTNSFVVDNLCCPSRATFLTGQHSHNHNVRSNLPPNGGVAAFDDSNTLPLWLRAAGYRTGLVGKYLNNYGVDTSQTYIPPGWDSWVAILNGEVWDYTLNVQGVLQGYGHAPSDYLTDVLAGHAVDFIAASEANDAQPWFLWVTPSAPHAIVSNTAPIPSCTLNYQTSGAYEPAPRHVGLAQGILLPKPPNFNEPSVGDKPAWLRNNFSSLTSAQVQCLAQAHRGRVEMMMSVDDLVGSLMGALQQYGEQNTLVVFTSDNGYALGEHRVSKKQQAYEEGIRVPLMVSGPGVAHGVATQTVLNLDLAPTLVELGGAQAGLVQDGRSLVPILDGVPGPWRTSFLIEHAQTSQTPITDYSAVRTTQYLWVEYTTGERELYDLLVDPWQLSSKHADPSYQTIKNTLRRTLQDLRTCVGGECWK